MGTVTKREVDPIVDSTQDGMTIVMGFGLRPSLTRLPKELQDLTSRE